MRDTLHSERVMHSVALRGAGGVLVKLTGHHAKQPHSVILINFN